MFRKMMTKMKYFINDCNSQEIKKLRQEAAIKGHTDCTHWAMYIF